MATADPDTDELLAAAAAGDRAARDRLVGRHRDRLRRMVSLRLDRPLAARLAPSDVVRDALAAAAARLDDYLARRPVPFYLWVRQIAWEQLVEAHRRHAPGRDDPSLTDASVAALAARLAASDVGPGAVGRAGLCGRVRAALDALPTSDREVLALRHLEQLSAAETATVLGCSEGRVKHRLLRALQRLRDLLDAGGD